MTERRDDASPWAPGSNATFVVTKQRERGPTPTPTPTPTSTSTSQRASRVSPTDEPEVRLVGRPRLLRSAAVVTVAGAVAAVVVVSAVLVISDREGGVDEDAAPVVTAAPATLPPPDQTLDEIALAATLRDTGDDVTLGRVDTPLARADGDCAAPRLPIVADERWSTVLPRGLPVVSMPVIAESTMFVPVTGVSDGGRTLDLVGIGVDNGVERWRTELVQGGLPFVGRLTTVEGLVVLAVSDGLVDDRLLTGVDIATGEVRWKRALAESEWPVVDETGTFLVTQQALLDEPEEYSVSVLDPASGLVESTVPGWFVGVIGESIVTRDSDQVMARRTLDDRTEQGSFRASAEPVTDAVLVGDTVVFTDGTELAGFRQLDDGAWAGQRFELRGVAGIDPPSQITSLRPLGGTSLLLMSADAVHGANLSGGSIELRWRRAGRLEFDVASDRGRTAVVRSDESSTTFVIDASTGRSVIEFENDSDVDVTPVSNGALVLLDNAFGGRSAVARDVDGRSMWSTSSGEFAIVGDRLVVLGQRQGDDLVLTALGEPSGGDARCGSVMREWIES